jgi:hypothetical protein
MRERAALSYSHRFRQRWQDVAIRVFDMAAPPDATHDGGTVTPGTATRQLNHGRAQVPNQINSHIVTMRYGTFRLMAGQPNSRGSFDIPEHHSLKQT